MATTLFERKARLVVGTQLIENLRMQFKVVRTNRKKPNTCEVSVSNLSENSRALLQQKHIKLILEAGYPQSIARLFSGNSRYVDQIREGADWVTKIQCGDGEVAYQYRRVAQSFAPGTRVFDVVKNITDAMGLTTTGLPAVAGMSEQFTQGYTAYGHTSVELDRLLTGRGFEWSIQDGQLQILTAGGVLPNQAIVLNENTGMLGSPEHGNPEKDIPLDPDQYVVTASKKQGPAILKVKSLLQPGFVPGGRVKVEAVGINGVFRIQTVTHSGDTHGDAWFSELECIPST